MDYNRILKMYKEGYSIDFIAKTFCKYKNRNLKPITLNGVVLFPAKIWNKTDCKRYVSDIIYKNLINGDLARTQI